MCYTGLVFYCCMECNDKLTVRNLYKDLREIKDEFYAINLTLPTNIVMDLELPVDLTKLHLNQPVERKEIKLPYIDYVCEYNNVLSAIESIIAQKYKLMYKMTGTDTLEITIIPGFTDKVQEYEEGFTGKVKGFADKVKGFADKVQEYEEVCVSIDLSGVSQIEIKQFNTNEVLQSLKEIWRQHGDKGGGRFSNFLPLDGYYNVGVCESSEITSNHIEKLLALPEYSNNPLFKELHNLCKEYRLNSRITESCDLRFKPISHITLSATKRRSEENLFRLSGPHIPAKVLQKALYNDKWEQMRRSCQSVYKTPDGEEEKKESFAKNEEANKKSNKTGCKCITF